MKVNPVKPTVKQLQWLHTLYSSNGSNHLSKRAIEREYFDDWLSGGKRITKLWRDVLQVDTEQVTTLHWLLYNLANDVLDGVPTARLNREALSALKYLASSNKTGQRKVDLNARLLAGMPVSAPVDRRSGEDRRVRDQ
jgi:hypothetical protein